VQGVQQDKLGFIWLALKDYKLARFDGISFQHYPMNEAEKQAFGNNVIQGLMIDEQGSFIVAFVDRLARFDPKTGRFSPEVFSQEGFDSIEAFWDKKWESNPWQKNWRNVENPPLLIRNDGLADTLHLDFPSRIYELLETGSEFWIASFEGLFKYTPRKKLFDTPLSQPFNPHQGLVTGRSVYGIAEWNGWLFFIEKGLWRAPLDHPEQAVRVVGNEHLNSFFGLSVDAEGWLWAGSSNNPVAVRIRPEAPFEAQRLKHPPAYSADKRSHLPLPDGRMLLACKAGLLLMNPADGTSLPIESDSVKNAWCLHRSAQGEVWAGTEDGLWRLSPQGKGFKVTGHYTTSNCKGFGSNKIISIHEAEGYLWLGSDGGLIRLAVGSWQSAVGGQQPSIARTFTMADGLPNNRVYFAIPDQGYLWCGTDWGLARIELATALKTSELPEVRNFHVDDGLPHEEFNTLSFFKSPTNGKIYLGGLNGLTVFSPKDLVVPPPAELPLYFTQLEKYDSKHDTTLIFDLLNQPATVEIHHYDQYFTLRFSLLSYANPSRNSYQYMMEGFEKKWNPVVRENFARYTALPPGRYTFRVRAADHNGNWSKHEIALPITVRRAWYATWWAWAMYLLAAGGLVFFFYKQRLQQVRLSAKAQHLEELDAFKSRFFTNITHEFRTPLTVILGNLEIMKLEIGNLTAESPSVPTRQAISQLLISKISMTRRNAASLLRLINQILDLAKLEDKSLKMNYIQGDVLPYLRYIAESLHSYANAQNVMLRVESSDAKIVMDYDPERLLSIVYNLLSNAIKFTPSGGKVTLRAGLLNLKGLVNLELAVSDTGSGIPPEDLPRVFDRFYQVQPKSGGDLRGGTGIGLSLTKELVKAMGGEIGVKSEVGAGTVFMVRLPLTRPLTWPLTPKGEPKTELSELTSSMISAEFDGLSSPFRGSGSLSHEGSPSILLIEDNPDVVEYLAACLSAPLGGGREWACQINFAYNGRAGIETALETIPDLIISDVMMPEKDGFEVCDFLKNDERTSHIPIVLLTAKADVESRIAGLKRGADAYLAKPFHQEELLVTVANLLETRRKLQSKYSGIAMAPIIPHPSSPIPDPENVFLQKLRSIVEPRLGEANLNAEEVCKPMGMSRSVLYAKLSALTGLSFNLYLRSLRLRKAQDLLRNSEMNVSEVAYEVGFNDPRYFIRVFSEEFGKPPGEWRETES
jgi:signal transduction histidine kinase/AraC-like DNA-binding protein